MTDLNWRPSVYHLKKIDKVLLIIDGDEDGTVSLNFYNMAPSYKMDHQIILAKDKFECGMLASDLSGEELDFIIVGFFFINNNSINASSPRYNFPLLIQRMLLNLAHGPQSLTKQSKKSSTTASFLALKNL